MNQSQVDRQIFGRYAFSFYPDRTAKDRNVKQLAESLVGLDLLTSLQVAQRFGELKPYAIKKLTELIASERGKDSHFH
jgi:hypothetical protein